MCLFTDCVCLMLNSRVDATREFNLLDWFVDSRVPQKDFFCGRGGEREEMKRKIISGWPPDS